MGIQDSIISYIRLGIVSCKFKPGTRLKGREHFCEKFSTTPITVQRAFNRLIQMGFVRAEKSVGTFVAVKPTCLYQVAFLFPTLPGSRGWTSFSEVVVNSISDIEKRAGVIVKCFYGMGKSEDYPEVFEEFQKHLDEQTLVAAIYLSELRNFRKRASMNVNIPYYVVAQPNHAHGHPRIELKKRDYYQIGISKFKELGRKRIAIVTVDLFISEREQLVKDIFVQNSLVYYEEYVQSFSINKAFPVEQSLWIDRFLRLLFSLSDNKKPDGIFVTDDNFLDAVYSTLQELGLKIGDEIDVIGHANFSAKQGDYPGIYQLGYNVPSTIITACKNLIFNSDIEDIMVLPELR